MIGDMDATEVRAAEYGELLDENATLRALLRQADDALGVAASMIPSAPIRGTIGKTRGAIRAALGEA